MCIYDIWLLSDQQQDAVGNHMGSEIFCFWYLYFIVVLDTNPQYVLKKYEE